MSLLANAAALRLGASAVSKVYAGITKVWPAAAPKVATLVQTSGAKSGNGGTETHTWAAAPTVGNTIIVIAVGWRGGTAPASISCADSAGNAYTVRADGGLSNTRGTILDAPVTTSPASSTVTYAGGSSDHSAEFMEWAGLGEADASSAITSTIAATGAGTFATGPTSSLAQSGELVIFGLGINTGTPISAITPPAGATLVAKEDNSSVYIGLGCAYRVVSSTAPVSGTWSYNAGQSGSDRPLIGLIATYKIT